MYPQFFVFVDGSPDLKMTGIIKGLWDLGYLPFVDAVNKNNKSWFEKNLKECAHRMYWFEEDGTFVVFDTKSGENPDLLVVFSEGLKITNEEWDLMNSLMIKIHCTSTKKVGEEIMEKIFKVFERPQKIQNEIEKKEEIVELPTAYAFRSMVVGNVGFYEIVKPNVIEPYVTMVENFEKYPFDMYTNWFKCFSFGVSGYDAAFIHQMYKNLNVNGKLDLEKEFRKRVERVVKEDDEPRIWRKKLEDVVEMYNTEKTGEKRKRIGIENMNKKV